MRLYRKELRADSAVLMKISALELMSKECSSASALSRHQEDVLLGHSHPDSFRSAIRLACVIGQVFSVLPTSTRPDIVPRFHYVSLRVLYWAVVTFLLGFNAVVAVVNVVEAQSGRNSIVASSNYIFYVSALTVSVLYFRVAQQWRELCLCFLRVEHRMRRFGYPPRLRCRLQTITVVVLSLALTEYSLAIVSGVLAMDLDKPVNEFFKDYYHGNYPQILLLIPYNPIVLLVCQLVNAIGTFMWNYNDMFVMLISVAIAQKFKLLNTKLYELPKKDKTREFWKEVRETYNSLSLLTREVDQILSVQILFSFMNNLYFICIQLLHTVKHEDNSIAKNIYFVFSFGLLLLRTACVSLCAASINDESKQVRKFLYSVSSRTYCEEVDRFIIQATTDEIALTGLKFFSLTRSFLLTVTGTIATYEIVLVQFSGNQKTV
ncbi:Gustatory receptor 31 [Frankliniella occidentalis]|nr:Gustatory receptor 31 [Frankliniella occidentalis]